ncbi:MAG: glycosyltransferase [Verrucomicrobiota bacterium]|jgi:glycosyltransferase involved in cell wall biosynthesis
MKISGFTFVRNGNSLGYPFVPAIRSLLPLCDEIIVNVPRSVDDTLEIVKSIGDPKIKILETEWDDNARTGGLILSHHTNLALEQCTGDWCVYIQADEVLHEDTIPLMRRVMEEELGDSAVQGLIVDYTHFYGSYWTQTCGFGWYPQEVRVVRGDKKVRSNSDAQSFRTIAGEKLNVKKSGGHYLHYGHARHPELARRRFREASRLWHDDAAVEKMCGGRPENFYDDDQKVKPFTGTHPAVMRDIVAAANWIYQSRNPLIRFKRRYFWKDAALLVKNCIGIEIGVHRNFRLLR